jgi:hypothetical protein
MSQHNTTTDPAANASPVEKHLAFEWLRKMALGEDVPADHHAAAIMLHEVAQLGAVLALKHSHAELLKFVIAERDAFFESSTDAEGRFTDPDDATELAEMDALIDRARAAQPKP